MAVETVTNLVETLRQLRLLTPEQIQEISALTDRFPDPKGMARELLQRGWLTPFQVNQIFLGKGQELALGGYLLLDRLGEGGMGQVFRARQISVDRIVALKIIRKDKLKSEQAARRFLREIKMASQLQHLNVVRAFDADLVGDTYFFAMEYVDGIDLAKWLKIRGPLPVNEACDFIRQAALGLQHAAEHGMIHRDIKPANLLVTHQNKVVKILDMGLARATGTKEGSEDSSQLTQENAVMGTPDYLAPEQARNAHDVDIRADLYSLGCTLYHLLAGRVPFPGGQLSEKLLKHQLDPATPLNQLRADIPPAVVEAVDRLMAKRPEHRFQTPAELANALACILRGERPAYPVVNIPETPENPSSTKSASNPFVDLGEETLKGSDSSSSKKLASNKKLGPSPQPSGWETFLVQAEKFGNLLLTNGKNVWNTQGGKYRWAIVISLGMLFFLGFVGCWLSGLGDKKENQKRPGIEVPKSSISPLDQLDAKLIPPEENLSWQPPEVVAVLGERRGRHPGLRRLAVSPDGKVLASTGSDHAITLWNPTTLYPLTTLKGHTGLINALLFSQDGKTLYSAGADRSIRVWQGTDTRWQAGPVLPDQDGSILALARSWDGKVLASGSAAKTVAVWDLSGTVPGKKFSLQDFQGEATSLSLSWTGKFLATGDVQKITVWYLASAQPEKMAETTLPEVRLPLSTTPPDRISSLLFSWNGQRLFVGGNYLVYLYDHDGSLVKKSEVIVRGPVTGLSFSPDETILAAIGSGLDLFKVDAPEGPAVAKAITPPGYTIGANWLGEESKLVSGHAEGTLRTWHFQKPSSIRPVRPLLGHPTGVVGQAFTPDGKYLATCGGGTDTHIFLWDLEGPKPKLAQDIQASIPIHCLAFSSDGKYLAAAGINNPYIVIWNLLKNDFQNPTALRALNTRGHTKGILSLAFSPDGKTLVSGGMPEICVWDLRANLPKEPLVVLEKHTANGVVALAFSPDGKRLASAGQDLQIGIWDLSPWPILKAMIPRAHTEAPTSLAFSPDGLHLFSGGKDNQVRSWDLHDFLELKDRFQGHKKAVTALALSPQTNLLATADQEGKLIVWDLNSYHSNSWQLESPITTATFAPDGRHLAVGTPTSAVLIMRFGLLRAN